MLFLKNSPKLARSRVRNANPTIGQRRPQRPRSDHKWWYLDCVSRARHELTDNGVADLENAPSSFRFEFVVSASPVEAFDYTADLETEHEWFPDFVRGEWQTPEPHGVGSRRYYETKDVSLYEHFLIWDRGEHLAFVGAKSNLPIISTFAESYRFTQEGDRTRVVWLITYTPKGWVKPLEWLIRPYFRKTFATAAAQLEARLNERTSAPARPSATG